MKHPKATVLIIFLILAFLPYLPIMNYEETKHTEPGTEEVDDSLPLVDSDGDRMPDDWEIRYGLDPLNSQDADYDKDHDGWDFNRNGFVEDGLINETHSNLWEYLLGTDPTNNDTDGDGMWDGWEIYYDLDPLDEKDALVDNDYDGFDINRDGSYTSDEYYSNIKEFMNDTIPTNPDSDGDRMWDGWEVYYDLDPLDPTDKEEDPDADGVDWGGDGRMDLSDNFTNYEEFLKKTNPRDNDTDNDDMIDGWEAFYYDRATHHSQIPSILMNADQVSPTSAKGRDLDLDGDLLSNYLEYKNPKIDVDNYDHTSPVLEDSDQDGLLDGWEIYQMYYNDSLLDPTTNDTDFDGMPDGWEINWNTGWFGDDEKYHFLDPTNYFDQFIDQEPDGWDVDRDGTVDSYELFTNVEEFRKNSNPFLTDTDGDGMPDGFEAAFRLDPSMDDSHEDFDLDSYNVYAEIWGLPIPESGGVYSNIMEFNNGVNWTIPSSNDTNPPDGDGMWDGWEVYYGLDPLDPNDAHGDPDNDGFDFDHNGRIDHNESFINLEEFLNGTDPYDPDTDNDTMPDGWEVEYGLNPLADDREGDLDGDNITNILEWTNTFYDVDGIIPMNPASNDTDGDGLMDEEETINGTDGYITDPTAPDTDLDGIPDGYEVDNGMNPTNASDADEDWDDDGAYLDLYSYEGVFGEPEGTYETDKYPYTNLMEYLNGTNIHVRDSDGDSMWDGWEVFHGLNATNDLDREQDKDFDSIPNYLEFNSTVLHESDKDGTIYTDPSRSDTDMDGLTDFEELNFLRPTDPTTNDSDDDRMPDGWEVKFDLNPVWKNDSSMDNDTDSYDINGDTFLSDGEYYSNLDEYQNGTNPTVADTDEDGIWDVWEAYYRYTAKHSKDENIRAVWKQFDPIDPDDFSNDADGDGLNHTLEFTNIIDYDGHLSTNPLQNDTDGDGVSDYRETYGTALYQVFSDPTMYDTDGDLIPDGWESNFTYGWIITGDLTHYFLNATDPIDGTQDPDNDGHNFPWVPDEFRVFTNYQEFLFWTEHPEYSINPFDPDSIVTGYNDGFIAYIFAQGGG